MKKLLLAFALVATLALARPAPADAHFSLSIGLPGFGLFLAPPVVYAPPVYYEPPVVYYRPGPVFYPRPFHRCGYGRPYGWYRHGRRWD